jgi:hypothetical protein
VRVVSVHTLSDVGLALILRVLASGSGCASGPRLPRIAWPTVSDPARVQRLLDIADSRYAAAERRADVESAMQAYEAVVALAPSHREALLKAARYRLDDRS